MKKSLLFLLTFCLALAVQAARPPKNQVFKKKKTIINGVSITASQAPYQALFIVDATHRGGGAILSPQWILTAAHIAALTPSTVRVGVSTISQSQGQTAGVAKIIKHPDYIANGQDPSNDLALIKIVQPLNLSGADAKAIRLASKADTSYWTPNKLLAVSGFGYTASGDITSLSNDLRRVDVRVLNNTNTQTSNVNKIDCLGPGINDSCQGDSGGPLTSYGTAAPSTPSVANGPLVGIVSSGLNGTSCGNGGRYMKVSKYVQWIFEAILEDSSPNYVCSATTFTKPDIMVDGVTNWVWGTTTPSLLSVPNGTVGNTAIYTNILGASGEGEVTLTLKNANGATVDIATRKVWVGPPKAIAITSDGTFTFSNSSPPNITICKYTGYCMTAKCEPMQDTKYSNIVTGFTWSQAPTGMYRNVQTYSIFGLPTVPNNQACFGASAAGTYMLTVTANTLGNNVCGTNSKNIIIQANSCGYRIAQNPTQTSLSVIFDNPELKESIPTQLDLLDEKSGKVLKTLTKANKEDALLKKGDTAVSLDVANLPRGLYYLHLTFGNRVDKVRVILN